MSEVSIQKTPNPLVYLFKKTWVYSAGNRRSVACFWFLFLCASSIELFCAPFVWAKIMNILQEQGITQVNLSFLFFLLFLTAVANLAVWFFHGPGRILERINAFKVRVNYRKHLLKGVITLPMKWHADHHSGDTIDKVEKGTNALYSFSEDTFQTIYALLELIGSCLVLLYFSPSSIVVLFGMMLAVIFMVTRIDRILIPQYKELNHAENTVSESTFDAISNITTVIILRVERLIWNAIVKKAEQPFVLFRKNAILNEIKWALTSICCSITTVLVLGIYFWQQTSTPETLLIGNVFLLIKYLERINYLFFHFTEKYGQIIKLKTRVENAEELDKDFTGENLSNHVLPKSWERIEIRGLDFGYQHDGDALHLENISLSIKRGERIALVGESGSGKTTLLKVMRDLYSPKNLELSVDGKKITDGFGGIARAISLVPQSPEIFATTILQNITLGADYEMDHVRHYTDMACFTEIVDALPKGFDSSIKEKGVNLSGGQQQRLALARGLLACHEKDIILLDESTSSVDAANEKEIYQNIFREFSEKTIISSTHRLHLLSSFDRIYVFGNGQIIGEGTLDDLLSSCVPFKELWDKYHNVEYSTEKEICSLR